MLADIMSFVPWQGFGPFESYDADHTIAGGETLELAGMSIDVLFTPGHLPGGDAPTLLRSIGGLLDRFGDDTTVYPGHMGITTLGRERATNPFLVELARS